MSGKVGGVLGARARRRAKNVFVYALALVAMVLSLFPIYWIFTLATKTQRDAFADPPTFVYTPVFGAFADAWNSAGFSDAFLNSVGVIALGVPLSLALAVPTAYAMSRFSRRPFRYMQLWLLLAYLLPEFLFAIPMYVLYQNLGIYDTVFGLALVYQVFALPISVWLLKSFFDEIPKEMAEAAAIDGASGLQTLLYVYLPLVRPGIAVAAILVSIIMWNEVTIALALTFEEAKTVTVAVAGFRGYAAVNWDEMAAASIIALAPMVLFASFAQRHIVKGLTAGSLK